MNTPSSRHYADTIGKTAEKISGLMGQLSHGRVLSPVRVQQILQADGKQLDTWAVLVPVNMWEFGLLQAKGLPRRALFEIHRNDRGTAVVVIVIQVGGFQTRVFIPVFEPGAAAWLKHGHRTGATRLMFHNTDANVVSMFSGQFLLPSPAETDAFVEGSNKVEDIERGMDVAMTASRALMGDGYESLLPGVKLTDVRVVIVSQWLEQPGIAEKTYERFQAFKAGLMAKVL
jgi:hypothetical protein